MICGNHMQHAVAVGQPAFQPTATKADQALRLIKGNKNVDVSNMRQNKQAAGWSLQAASFVSHLL
jgi:hypothetical protein